MPPARVASYDSWQTSQITLGIGATQVLDPPFAGRKGAMFNFIREAGTLPLAAAYVGPDAQVGTGLMGIKVDERDDPAGVFLALGEDMDVWTAEISAFGKLAVIEFA